MSTLNNSYLQFQESGLTIDEFATQKSAEWLIPKDEIIILINNAMQKLRKPLYPDIGDQLDSLFRQGLFDIDMTAKIQAVKNQYPKP